MLQHSDPPASLQVTLKDPFLAGVLAWLLPGAGHLYQGRRAKAGLFFVCILGTFLYGLYLGSSPDNWGRVVYFSFRQNDVRLAYLCQMGIGLPALPALVQANRVANGKAPLPGNFMAPPALELNEAHQLVPKTLYRHGPRWYELGTVYTMIAGLLNILAIYDACCGPVFTTPPSNGKKRKDDPQTPDTEAENKS